MIKAALVHVDKILFHPLNTRNDLGDLRGLSASIRRNGIMQPVILEPYGKLYRLRAGHRRVAAAKLIDMKRVPSIVHDQTLNDREWIEASIQENFMREELALDERQKAIQNLRKLGCTWSGVAAVFNRSVGTVRNWSMGHEDRPEQEADPIVQLKRKTAKTNGLLSKASRLAREDVCNNHLEEYEERYLIRRAECLS